MQILDLHGIKHENVDDIVRRFLNYVELPCEIVTGKSWHMKEMVQKVVSEYSWTCYEKDSYNYGTLIIMERKV